MLGIRGTEVTECTEKHLYAPKPAPRPDSAGTKQQIAGHAPFSLHLRKQVEKVKFLTERERERERERVTLKSEAFGPYLSFCKKRAPLIP
jgi:hypothetical protein